MTLENLVNVNRPLAEASKQLDPATIQIQHAREITAERRTNRDLRNQWFWTADFPMYTVEDGEAVLYFAGRDNNLIFKNIDEATELEQEIIFLRRQISSLS